MNKISFSSWTSWSWYLLLIPVFWALHGYVQYYPLVQAFDAVHWGLLYFGTGLTLAGIGWLYLRSGAKSALLAGIVIFVELFFGPFHDFLKSFLPNIFLVKYSFLLPAGVATFLYATWKMKNYQRSLRKIAIYLNLLFLLLIVIDGVRLILPNKDLAESGISEDDISLTPLNINNKQDVYLLVADGYPGELQLRTTLNFDNSIFTSELCKRGFRVIDSSRSNYNFTQYSMASLLNMEYLKENKGTNSDLKDITQNYNTIKRSRVINFFSKRDYNFYNCSIFDFPGQPSGIYTSFLFRREKPLRAITLSYRIYRDLGYHLATTFKLPFIIRDLSTELLRLNELIINKTHEAINTKKEGPRFVYTHLNMPHYPYVFDSTGTTLSYNISDSLKSDTSAFISYLKFSNKKILGLVDSIKQKSKHPPIILLISDHGFREYPYPVDPAITFYNLMALHIPGADSADWPAGMTNVNLFRTLLRTKWGLALPNLSDSTFVIRD